MRDDYTDDANDSNDALEERRARALVLSDECNQRVSRFRHFGDEWQQICQTLVSCERLLTVMSNERHRNDRDDRWHDTHDIIDDTSRQQLRQIIKSIEPKKYSKYCARRQSSGRRSSYHRLKALTQLLMASNLKRSTSLQSMAVHASDVSDDTTATLPRLRRRPKINRFYQSLDASDDNNDSDDNASKKVDRSGLSLVLSSSPSTQLLPTSAQTQKQLNRHSCDITTLLSPSSFRQTRDIQTTNGQKILKFARKGLRGPFGEILESRMSTRAGDDTADVKHNLSFIQELLRETEKQRKALDDSARETTGTATKELATETTPTTTANETTDETTSQSITATIGRHLFLQDTRTHIVGELYDTEKSFCERLRDLMEKYAKPLHEALIIDSIFVEIIFGKIPEILSIHNKFLEELRHRIKSWTPTETTIGDLFALFEEKTCFDAYMAFMDNWLESKQLIKQLSREKPLFQKFLNEQTREHKSKLSLDDHMIGIIQRIPRLELLLNRLLKHTRKEHNDYELVNTAITKMHSLVLYINRVKNDADVLASSHTSSLSSGTTAGQHLDVSHSSISLTQLEVIVDGLPVHALMGAHLHLICFVVIRKRERILLLFSNLLIILALKGRKKSEKFEENKYKVLNFFSVESLEVNDVNRRQTDDSTETTTPVDDNCLEVLERDLQIVQTMQSSFVARLSSHSKHFLDSVFYDLNQNINKKMNELKNEEKNLELSVLSLNDVTRAHQSPHESAPPPNPILMTFISQEIRQKFEEILKELKSEKERPQSGLQPEFLCFLPIRKTRAGLQFTCASPTMGRNDVWICNSDGFVGQISVLSLNGSQIEPTVVSCNGVCNSRIICMTCVPNCQPIEDKDSEDSGPESGVSDSDCGDAHSDSNTTSERQPDDRQASCWPTMWFGTDDSSVHIYSCFDAIRIKKNKVKVPLSAKVEAITYFNERVFVALANQSVAVFHRDPISGKWMTTPEVRERINCFRFCAVSEHELWTSGFDSLALTIRDADLRPLYPEVVVPSDTVDHVTHLVGVANRVFICTHNSLSIHIFSQEEPFTHLALISVQTTLHRALIGCEDIIRQHKSACLRISSLLAVQGNVWIGTSAGIVCVLDARELQLEIVPNGHTGHVRFLTSIETRDRLQVSGNETKIKTIVISGGDGIEIYGSGPKGRTSGQVMTSGQRVTGNSGQDIGNGREDSTNHLLLWQISQK